VGETRVVDLDQIGEDIDISAALVFPLVDLVLGPLRQVRREGEGGRPGRDLFLEPTERSQPTGGVRSEVERGREGGGSGPDVHYFRTDVS
jgi:hypothetical protein